ncbi:MAG: GNAT family protein [Anaerolineae bacterium]
MTNLFLGERVRLTALRPDDAQTLARWYEDGEFSRLFDASPAYPKTESSLIKWMETTDRDRDAVALGIRSLYSDELIGYVDIDGIQWTHRCGWLAIGIGNPANRRQGYGTEAMRLVLGFAFNELNLHRLQLSVFAYNEAAIRLYEKLGFTREGAFREYLLRDGKRCDMLLYGLLASEWAARQPAE